MLFTMKHLGEIKSGKITLAFRKWKKLAVKNGSRVQTGIGLVEISALSECNRNDISEQDAIQAGFRDSKSLLAALDKFTEGSIYKMDVKYFSEDPRIDLREQPTMPDEEFEALKEKLTRLDQASKLGNWTIKVLRAIQENPKLRAADLAVKAKKEKEWLKLNVRKLKNLGLTISHEPGYTLSPLGEHYLERVGTRKA
ncbi:ASCH domain-containing protein [Dyadobacter arcticus]|uniref:ASCH domain-containing protein n=1 Tax=Dyadobacter arcticus TaxID=1078754 RepID=A0ABX0UN51_9BACT|nr:ASCH domain-containing protein [Dyadobacter arcticus]NIJ54407.1 hypothetical protein [Dyadobacter arcticus]